MKKVTIDTQYNTLPKKLFFVKIALYPIKDQE